MVTRRVELKTNDVLVGQRGGESGNFSPLRPPYVPCDRAEVGEQHKLYAAGCADRYNHFNHITGNWPDNPRKRPVILRAVQANATIREIT